MELINQDKNIFGCYVSGPALNYDATIEDEKLAEEKGALFRKYIWGDNGVDDILKKVINIEYGNDIRLILFQFYLNPLPFELENLQRTEGYRKKEKSIGANIIVTDENFFNKEHSSRVTFIKNAILNKLKDLKQEYSNKKIDTRFDLLIDELKKIF